MKKLILFIKHLHDDDILGVSAQTTFYLLFALFPMLLFIITLLGLLDLSVSMNELALVLPESVLGLIEQLPDTKGTGFLVVPVIVALWSASSAVWAFMRGIHRSVNGERLKMTVKARGIALVLTLGFVAAIAIPIAASIFIRSDKILLDIVSRIGAACIIFLFIASLYTFTPKCGSVRKYRVAGAAAATALWLVFNFLFERFSRIFLKINPLYSSVSAVLSVAVWIYAISFIILLGAEINAHLSQN
ncbi:MAG: YihY/virulence factor BrkB family protein [Oscillospiraceae bacterium]|nr:YihY/virulence factor BrkB family protein [Oscillospiraceae bacterium]